MNKIAFLPEYRKNRFNDIKNIIENSSIDLLMYSFADIYIDGFIGFKEIDFLNLKIKKVIETNNINLGMCIGGAKLSTIFPLMLGDIDIQDKFIHYLNLYVLEFGFTHICFDYEFPTDNELNPYFNLITRVKNELNIDVSVCVTPDCDWSDSYLNQVDFVYVMAYDFYKVPNKETHHTPVEIIDYIENNFTIDKNRIICGIPLYAKSLTNNDYLIWDDMIKKDENKYLTTNEDNDYSWNNLLDVDEKINRLNTKGFNGYFFWDIGMDNIQHIITK